MSTLNERHKEVILKAWERRGYTVDFELEEVVISKKGRILERRPNDEVIRFLENAFSPRKKSTD